MSTRNAEDIIQKLVEISWSYYFQIMAMKTIAHETFRESAESNKIEDTKKEVTEPNKEKMIQKLIEKAKTESLSYRELYQLYDALYEAGKLDMIQNLPLPEDLKNELEKIYTTQLLAEEAFKPFLEISNTLSKIISPITELYARIKKRTEQEKQQIILRSMLIQSIVLWESLLKDYLRVLLYYDSRPLLGLKNEKIFSIAEIIRAEEEYPDIRSMVIERYVDSIFFGKNIDEISDELSRLSIIELKEFQEWENLREAYYRRNIFVHNNGRANETYCKKLGINTCPLGEDIELTYEYINNLLNVISEFLVFIHENNYVVRKLKRNNFGGESNG